MAPVDISESSRLCLLCRVASPRSVRTTVCVTQQIAPFVPSLHKKRPGIVEMGACSRAAWCFVVVLCALCATEAQVPGFGKKREIIPLLREDIKFIECEMCEKVSKHLHRTVNRMREALPKWDKLTEAAIFDQLEVMCDPAKDAGEWISHLDIQEDGDRLRVVEMTGAADCQRECMTLARVCSNLMNEHDIDLAELLYRQVTRAQLSNALCRELCGACKRKPPPFLGPRADGEAFVVMDADQLRMKKMMNDMQAQGMSGSLMDRDSIKEQYRDTIDNYDDAELESFGLGDLRSEL